MKNKNIKKCGYCGKPFIPKTSRMKFCSSGCSTYNCQKKRRIITKGDAYRTLLLEYYGNKCNICNSTEGLLFHHLIALENGGSHTLGNVILICKRCHFNIHHGIFQKELEKKVNQSDLKENLTKFKANK